MWHRRNMSPHTFFFFLPLPPFLLSPREFTQFPFDVLFLEKFRWTAGRDFIPRDLKAADRLLKAQKTIFFLEKMTEFRKRIQAFLKKYKNF